MNKRARIITGSLLALIVILVAVALFVRYEIRRSFPQTQGTIIVSGLRDTVSVIRDLYGVPTIKAKNDHDLFMATGLVHAQDRLWQMDFSRRAAAGQLSEIFGSATLQFDAMFRTAGLARTAAAEERLLSPAMRDRLQWYADGVNAWIARSQGRLPLEFDLLQYSPEPWQPIHSLLVGKLLAWVLNLSWWTDITYGALVARLGEEKALSIYPGYPEAVAPEVPASVWRAYAALDRSFLTSAIAYNAFTGSAGFAGGSNAWAVAPRRSATRAAILANDTHLRLQLPSQWYELSLMSPSVNVAGMSMAGVPAVIAGRNAQLAWGVTNVMADDADFYIEQIDSTDSTQYLYDGAWHPMTVHMEEIGVRGETPASLRIRVTQNGPIVTDLRTGLQRANAPFVVSMRWTGAEPGNSLAAFAAIDTARTWSEFTEGLKLFAGPSQNFVYADVDGNIGYWCAGKIPIHAKPHPMLPLPGWERESQWKGYIPFRMLPHLFNPPSGYIASANNKLADDNYPYTISDLWEPPARIQRLRDILGADSVRFSAEEFARMQTDSYSQWAKEIVPYIMNAMQDSALGIPDEVRLMEYFKNWDFEFRTSDIATSVFEEFIVHLLRNTFADEMGDELFHDWVMLANVPIRVVTALLQADPDNWFDDISTPQVETRDMIIRKSLREACTDLRDRLGDDMKRWQWGNLHTVTLQHPFGMKKPLDRIFNVGPYPVDGASTALISGEYDFNDPYAVTVGPSFRQIFSLGSGETRAVLAGGESGQVFDPHYADQVPLWLHGTSRIEHWGTLPAQQEVLRLLP